MKKIMQAPLPLCSPHMFQIVPDWMKPHVMLVGVCQLSTCVTVYVSAMMDQMSGTVSG